jgi:hypothetical protein
MVTTPSPFENKNTNSQQYTNHNNEDNSSVKPQAVKTDNITYYINEESLLCQA